MSARKASFFLRTASLITSTILSYLFHFRSCASLYEVCHHGQDNVQPATDTVDSWLLIEQQGRGLDRSAKNRGIGSWENSKSFRLKGC